MKNIIYNHQYSDFSVKILKDDYGWRTVEVKYYVFPESLYPLYFRFNKDTALMAAFGHTQDGYERLTLSFPSDDIRALLDVLSDNGMIIRNDDRYMVVENIINKIYTINEVFVKNSELLVLDRDIHMFISTLNDISLRVDSDLIEYLVANNHFSHARDLMKIIDGLTDIKISDETRLLLELNYE